MRLSDIILGVLSWGTGRSLVVVMVLFIDVLVVCNGTIN
jgi:hypothetical protein